MNNELILDNNNTEVDKNFMNRKKCKKCNNNLSLKKKKISLMVYYNEYNKRREWPKTSI